MAVVTPDFLQALFTSYRIIWEEAFLAATSATDYQRYCTVIPSTTDTESYNWLGTVPVMSEWLDERRLQGLGSFNFSIKNRHWEASIEVDRNTIEDDRYNLIKPRIAQLGMEAARYPAYLAMQVLSAGSATACYDSANFFATTHTEEGLANQSNIQTGTGTTLAAVRADFIGARTLMRRIKDGKGRPMNIQPDLVVVPPDLQDVFEQLLHTNMIALGSGTQQSNVLMGAADIMVDANLTDTNPAGHADDWYLLSTKNIIKPLIFQNRKPPEFVSVIDPADSKVFNTRKFMFGIDARFNVGCGLWQLATQVQN